MTQVIIISFAIYQYTVHVLYFCDKYGVSKLLPITHFYISNYVSLEIQVSKIKLVNWYVCKESLPMPDFETVMLSVLIGFWSVLGHFGYNRRLVTSQKRGSFKFLKSLSFSSSPVIGPCPVTDQNDEIFMCCLVLS